MQIFNMDKIKKDKHYPYTSSPCRWGVDTKTIRFNCETLDISDTDKSFGIEIPTEYGLCLKWAREKITKELEGLGTSERQIKLRDLEYKYYKPIHEYFKHGE